MAGPVAAAVGVAVGAVVGGYAGKSVGELIDPTSEDNWLRDNFKSRPTLKRVIATKIFVQHIATVAWRSRSTAMRAWT